jgi:hypothetical protein
MWCLGMTWKTAQSEELHPARSYENWKTTAERDGGIW